MVPPSGLVDSPSLISPASGTGNKMAANASPSAASNRRLSSAAWQSMGNRVSPLKLTGSSKRSSRNIDSSAPKTALARLSYHMQSPLFKIPSISPTFTVNLMSDFKEQQNSPGPVKALNYSKRPSTSRSDSPTPAPQQMQMLSARSLTAAVPLASSRSIEAQNTMIDQQLEMLGELFPKEMKKYSQTVDVKELEATMQNMDDAPPLPLRAVSADKAGEAPDDSSDYQHSPGAVQKSRMSQLLSDWPSLTDVQGDDEGEQVDTSQLAGDVVQGPIKPAVAANSPDKMIPISEGEEGSTRRSVIARRSLNPNLRVDTTGSQQYATKEIQLIRKMKEEGRLKQEAKITASQPSKAIATKPMDGAAAEISTKVAASSHANTLAKQSPQVDPRSRQLQDITAAADAQAMASAEFRVSVVDESEENDRVASMLPASRKKAHRKLPSTDSAVSGIVWSAVVEKFSEMAQEIAGEAPSKAKTDSATLAPAEAASNRPSRPTSPNPAASHQNLLGPSDHLTVNHDAGTSVKPATVVQSMPTEYPGSTTSESMPISLSPFQIKGDSAPDSSIGDSLPAPALEASSVPAKRRSRSQLVSAMKATVDSSQGDDELSESPPAPDLASKVKRARTVRVQSHHANVEGDYAAFLKKATGADEENDKEDTANATSVKSGKSGRSAWSGKSGVENGMFRRGSMRSILTGRTIATVGDVSIRDLSRGARFRHPNPFFSQQHGFRKVKAPHQAGPGVLRRKGSKIVRLSVFEGRSAPAASTSLGLNMKRRSDDGETLGIALARLKDEKKKAPGPLIGELSFENDDPAKPIPKRAPAPIRKESKGKDPMGGYSASAVGIGSLLPQDRMQPKLGYAATSFTPAGPSKSGPAKLTAANLGQASSSLGVTMPMKAASAMSGSSGFPFPAVPGRPPMPPVSLKGFPPNGYPGSTMSTSSGNGFKGPASALSIGSASRAHMLGGPQSTISLSNSRHNLQPPLPAKPGQTPTKRGSPGSSMKRPVHSQTTPIPNSMPMSTVENSFISITPGRSEISVASARSKEKEQWDQLANKAAAVGNSRYNPGNYPTPQHTLGTSAPSSSLPPSAVRTGDPKGKAPMRSATAPLPPMPAQSVSSAPLPFRSGSQSHVRGDSGDSVRSSASRPSAPLSIDTEAAKEQSRRAMQAKQQQAVQQQRTLPDVPSSVTGPAATAPRSIEQRMPTAEYPQRMAGGNMPPDTATMGKTPKSAASAIASVFAPKRPARKDTTTEIPLRVPRPPSAEPVDNALNTFTGGGAPRRDSEVPSVAPSAGGSSTMSKTKGINKIFGFGRNKGR